MASYFLFAIYTIILSWWICKSKWVRSSGLPQNFILFFFLLKILAGCIYGYWYSYQQHADTWSFHNSGLIEYELLFNDPWRYLTNLFDADYPDGWRNIFASENSDWNDLKDHLMIKFISLMDIISFGNYYVNVIIYSFVTFFGYIFLYKALTVFYGRLTKGATFLLFFTPSCLFWTSGIHKDGLVLLLIGAIIYQLSKIFFDKKGHSKRWLVIGIALILILLLRSYVMLTITPAIIALTVTYSLKISPLRSFAIVYTLAIAIFFISGLIHPDISFPQKIVDYRHDFQNMSGASRLPQSELQPQVGSFISHIPEALDHAVLRPYLWQAKSVSEFIAGIEVIVFLIIIVMTVFFHKGHPNKQIDWFLAFFSFSVLFFIGLVVTFSGAIVRYRAIYIMMILVVSCQYLDHQKLLDPLSKWRQAKKSL